jgi:hypothetical protein
MEEQQSRLERPAMRICDLLLGPPSDQARLADRLDEAAEYLTAELVVQQEAHAELEALWTSAMRVRGLVLGSADGPSSLATNRVRWGPVRHWLPSCHISWSYRANWRCSGPHTMRK